MKHIALTLMVALTGATAQAGEYHAKGTEFPHSWFRMIRLDNTVGPLPKVTFSCDVSAELKGRFVYLTALNYACLKDGTLLTITGTSQEINPAGELGPCIDAIKLIDPNGREINGIRRTAPAQHGVCALTS